MPSRTITVPDMGNSVDAVVIVEWHVEAGHRIDAGAALVTVEVEKVDAQIPSPVPGVVTEILAGPGTELGVGDPMCVIDS
ncbi:MAG: lipoyl domain-containing protein [Acidimicrobiia bacterium]|nr:lipoyl domain-containing protein [Acidimicrobiia bacterium]